MHAEIIFNCGCGGVTRKIGIMYGTDGARRDRYECPQCHTAYEFPQLSLQYTLTAVPIKQLGPPISSEALSELQAVTPDYSKALTIWGENEFMRLYGGAR